ncbi:MAG: hypothetical protein MJ153_00390 [Clostridia bacterium]|nr:hypothetical protein [Clostridia bacterium]
MTFDCLFYENRAEDLKRKIQNLSATGMRLSFVRLFLFLAAVASIVLYSNDIFPIPAITAGLLFVVFFIFACKKHSAAKRKLKDAEYQYAINKRYIDRIVGDFTSVEDDGSEFFISNHDYCNDLDLFGKKSLFALYNISESDYGRKMFADELLYAPVKERSKEDIIKRQKAAEEFALNPVFLQEYQALAKRKKVKSTPADIKRNIEKAKLPSINVCYAALLWIVPLILLFINPVAAKICSAVIIIINLFVWFINLSQFSIVFNGMTSTMRSVSVLIDLFSKIELSGFKSEMVSIFEKEKYSESLVKINRIANLVALRSQPICDLFINMIFPLDILLCGKLVSWEKKYGSKVSGGMEKLAELESVMSASLVEIISKDVTTPEFVDNSACFKGENIYHPLIKPDDVISNSISIDNNIVVITGSNMSGKTTLIRTVGTVSLLAYMGAKVPADKLVLSRMRIMSSMRIADNLDEGISTFKAELDKISLIIKAGKELKGDSKLLFLIDEIFRGTNSLDRTEGALVVLRNLSKVNICGMMTTHDYAMCDEAKNTMDNIDYYHFAEKYTDEGIVFDYKLLSGTSYKSNAKYLMRLVGIE